MRTGDVRGKEMKKKKINILRCCSIYVKWLMLKIIMLSLLAAVALSVNVSVPMRQVLQTKFDANLYITVSV